MTLSDCFGLLFIVWGTPIVLWITWFVFGTPIDTKVGVYIEIGPGCEFGLYISKEEFYWCPFGMLGVRFVVV